MTPTPQQIARKERNARYRQKLLVMKKTPEDISDSKIEYFSAMSLPWKKLPAIILLIAITAILVFFQSRAYRGENPIVAWSLSILCETSLIYLSVTMRRSVISCILYALLFLYTIFATSFDIRRSELFKTSHKMSHDLKISMLKGLANASQTEIDQALRRGETVGKRLKALGETIETFDETLKKENETSLADQNMIKYEAWMLIVLRALLICISARLMNDLIPLPPRK